MIYEVSRFGYYRTNDKRFHPGWQSHYVVAQSPGEAEKKALPLMDARDGFSARDPAEMEPAKCQRHPRYAGLRSPANRCGVCHAMWSAVLEARETAAQQQTEGGRES